MQNQYDAIYEEIAREMETGKTEKGLWTRLFAECSGDEQQTKVLYIKQRAEKLISAERARLEQEASERAAENVRVEAARLEQLRGTADGRLVAAVYGGSWSIARQLLEEGVKPDGLDERGNSLIELARKRNDHQMFHMLESYGATQVTSALQVAPTSELAEGVTQINIVENNINKSKSNTKEDANHTNENINIFIRFGYSIVSFFVGLSVFFVFKLLFMIPLNLIATPENLDVIRGISALLLFLAIYLAVKYTKKLNNNGTRKSRIKKRVITLIAGFISMIVSTIAINLPLM